MTTDLHESLDAALQALERSMVRPFTDAQKVALSDAVRRLAFRIAEIREVPLENFDRPGMDETGGVQ